jgi:thymidylate synthase ThyX
LCDHCNQVTAAARLFNPIRGWDLSTEIVDNFVRLRMQVDDIVEIRLLLIGVLKNGATRACEPLAQAPAPESPASYDASKAKRESLQATSVRSRTVVSRRSAE